MLREELEKAKRLVNTDTVQITIGEIATMYSEKELDIIPEFQRLFRWSIEKKSSFIESILIGIPIPPVFAFENEDGTWELIDGLQRISTILEFMGVLRDTENSGKFKHSVLTKTKYLPSLHNVGWSEDIVDTKTYSTVEKPLQLFFRRARIDFQILKHPSDPKTKYDLFQRLNRGGAYANEQEVRTCSMVLANRDFTRGIRKIAEDSVFCEMFRVNANQKLNQTNLEYAVRCIVHTFRDYSGDSDVQEFIDKAIIDILVNDKSTNVLSTIKWTLETLHSALGKSALIPPDSTAEEVAQRFSMRALECIVVGIARNKSTLDKKKDLKSFIKARVKSFWKQKKVAEMSSTGLRGTTRLQRTIPFGEKWFKVNA
jgi:hypothetical protein